MKIAVIGSRSIKIDNIRKYIPGIATEIISGGAKGVDTLAYQFAKENSIKFTEFLPEYQKYGRAAPIVRNDKIIDYADEVIALWDGNSRGTQYVINKCQKLNKKITIYNLSEPIK